MGRPAALGQARRRHRPADGARAHPRLRAFFLRGPDRDHEAVYRRLLRKNLDTRDWRFAIDDDGDLYLLADTPLDGLDVDRLDGLLGSLSTLVDETYESVVRLGFAVPEGTIFGPPPSA